MARLCRIAGWPEIPRFRSTTDSTSNCDKTIEFLRSGNYLNVDIFGLQIGDRRQTGCAARHSSLSRACGTIVLEAFVVIQNKNIGHSLIPEVRDLYEAWVQFTVTDATGNKIYESGFLKPDGTLDPRRA